MRNCCYLVRIWCVGEGVVFLKILGIAGIVFLSFAANPALADRVRCNFDAAASAHFMPSQFEIEIDPVMRSAVVIDDQFDAINDGPMRGEIVTSNKKRQTIVWKSPLITPNFYRIQYNRAFNVEFRLTLPRGSSKAILTYKALQLGVYVTNPVAGTAEGTCKPQ